ncbi:hypothetical protein HK098_002473 [Nowakowskiella sp. JEL0407]|nr:hypothetical protein HK098_002473 [Nowakowskiella sp. JEL0407]
MPNNRQQNLHRMASDDTFVSVSKHNIYIPPNDTYYNRKQSKDFKYQQPNIQQYANSKSLQQPQQNQFYSVVPNNSGNGGYQGNGNEYDGNNRRTSNYYGENSQLTLPQSSRNKSVPSGLNKINSEPSPPQKSPRNEEFHIDKTQQDILLITILNHKTVSSDLSHFVAALIYTIWHKTPFVGAVALPSENVRNFAKFCDEILKATALSFSVLLLALKLIHRLLEKNPNLKGDEGSECRMLVCALMLAMKVLMDNTYTNRTWNKVSKIPIEELNVMEIEFLVQLRFDLYVTEAEYYRWTRDVDIAVREFKTISAAVSKRSSLHGISMEQLQSKIIAPRDYNDNSLVGVTNLTNISKRGALSYTHMLFDASHVAASAANLNGTTLARPRKSGGSSNNKPPSDVVTVQQQHSSAQQKMESRSNVDLRGSSSGVQVYAQPAQPIQKELTSSQQQNQPQRTHSRRQTMQSVQQPQFLTNPASLSRQKSSGMAYTRQQPTITAANVNQRRKSAHSPNLRPTSALYSQFTAPLSLSPPGQLHSTTISAQPIAHQHQLYTMHQQQRQYEQQQQYAQGRNMTNSGQSNLMLPQTNNRSVEHSPIHHSMMPTYNQQQQQFNLLQIQKQQIQNLSSHENNSTTASTEYFTTASTSVPHKSSSRKFEDNSPTYSPGNYRSQTPTHEYSQQQRGISPLPPTPKTGDLRYNTTPSGYPTTPNHLMHELGTGSSSTASLGYWNVQQTILQPIPASQQQQQQMYHQQQMQQIHSGQTLQRAQQQQPQQQQLNYHQNYIETYYVTTKTK